MRLIALALALLASTAPLHAQERTTLGFGRIFHNDFFGDGQDRWRTGGYTFSIVRGPEWQGRAPARPGAILEYRLKTEIISPDATAAPGTDRPYVGSLTAGLHSHWTSGAFDISAGGDLMFIGPSTGVSDFHEGFHDFLSMPKPVGPATQLGDATHFGLTGEMSRQITTGDNTTLRPFIEVQAGIETLARVGADFIWGSVGPDDLLLRDSVTGQLYRGTQREGFGFSGIFGVDVAQVADSVYLPSDRGFVEEETRYRLRAGVHSQMGERISWFYGLTYLSEEYEGQPKGQTLGSLKLNFNF